MPKKPSNYGMIRWAALLAEKLMQSPCHPFFRHALGRLLVGVAVGLVVGRMRKGQGVGLMGLMGLVGLVGLVG